MESLSSINPANNQLLGTVVVTSAAEIAATVLRAHKAKLAWKMLGVGKRAEMFKPLQALIEKNRDHIAATITNEMGKPITQAMGEIDWAITYLNDFIANGPRYLANEITFADKSSTHYIVYEPHGVAACIVPWNFPFSNFIVNAIPLLIAGNTVVFKHSEECVLMGKLIEELMQTLFLPDGVFAVIHGAGNVGQQLMDEKIDLINFTGSTTTGKHLAAVAGKKQIKAILEMGGSDPAIVFEDAPINEIIPALFSRRFDNCGQVCCALKRLIVQESIYDAVVAQLVAYLKTVIIGDPLNPLTQLGPLAAARQFDLLETQVAQSVAQGAHVAIGGKKLAGSAGAYYLPTILTHIKPEMTVWKDEVFGPVLPVMAFSTEAEAIHLANVTVYGLSASVFSNDINRARRVAAQIDAGCVDINLASHWLPCNPFGGYKASGMGRIYGAAGFRDMCQIKVIAE